MDKAQRLVLEEKDKKRVMFSKKERKEDIISVGREEWEELKREVRELRELREKWVECEKWLKKMKGKEIGWEARITRIEVGWTDLGKEIGKGRWKKWRGN